MQLGHGWILLSSPEDVQRFEFKGELEGKYAPFLTWREEDGRQRRVTDPREDFNVDPCSNHD
jgi:hypothetical protein